MHTAAFDFDLPAERIALRPMSPRDGARLLLVRPHESPQLADQIVADLPGLLRPGDTLVVNDTRVIPGRLTGVRVRAGVVARIEATLHKREADDRWWAFLRPAKKVDVGERIRFGEDAESSACLLGALDAEVLGKRAGGEGLLGFAFTGAILDEAIERLGRVPLPPYIAGRRAEDDADTSDYQTMFAREPGAVAAPTAGLHFTDRLLAHLSERGIGVERVTLHVGAGTFLPVKTDDIRDHQMQAEYGVVSHATADALNETRARGSRIVAVGTTSLRLLETAVGEDGTIFPYRGDTAAFITPGYRFRAVDALMTNFHLPRSTLFMLVAAFSGLDTMRAAYAHAIAAGYRFYSYGDANLLWPAEPRAP